MTENKSKVAAVYVRVSTGRQDAENQLLQLRPYCERAGYTISQEYMDVVSGAEDNRPAFNQLFRDAHMRKFDVLVFWAIDRFSRSGMYFTIQKLQELKNLGIDWDSYQEPYFRTIGPFGDAVLGIMATLAKMERERLSERTKAGLARKRLTGWVPGRKKGVKDMKPRRRKGYYDNQNWAGKKRGVDENPLNTPQLVRYGSDSLSEKGGFVIAYEATLKVDLPQYNKNAVKGAVCSVSPEPSRLGDKFVKIFFHDLSQMDILKEEIERREV